MLPNVSATYVINVECEVSETPWNIFIDDDNTSICISQIH